MYIFKLLNMLIYYYSVLKIGGPVSTEQVKNWMESNHRFSESGMGRRSERVAHKIPVSKQPIRKNQHSSDTPFIDSLGPAPNAIILDILHMHDNEEGVTRDTITKEIVRWKKERKYKIPGGRDSCIFWTRHLESVDLIKAISNRPKRYRLNNSKQLVRVVLDSKESWKESLRDLR